MKKLGVIVLLSLTGCGQEGSPEGRSKIRDEKIQQELADIKEQGRALFDSICMINGELNELRRERCLN
nr:hypothetical protein [uncultured Sphingobacterium sp.]